MIREELLHEILNVQNNDFDSITLKVFQYQFTNNPFYRAFCKLLNRTPQHVFTPNEIPFLPIQFFKSQLIRSGEWEPEIIFESSGTTGQIPSRHAVRSLEWYKEISISCFNRFYGDPGEYCWLGLLPSYLERENASLPYMVDFFIQKSKHDKSGFFLDDFDRLRKILLNNIQRNIPTVLIGVSFGLLDFAESGHVDLSDVIVMETGGMKGRRKEMVRSQLHDQLHRAFSAKQIHSEYGMTELLSQSYSKGYGRFNPGPSKSVSIADMTDPFERVESGRRGVIQVTDLANLDTCSFIATEDIGIKYEDGSFEVLGRLDQSEMRGCNLMVSDIRS